MGLHGIALIDSIVGDERMFKLGAPLRARSNVHILLSLTYGCVKFAQLYGCCKLIDIEIIQVLGFCG